MLLQKGSQGEEVRLLQQKLVSLGYSVGSAGADGDFGQGTYNAVVKFQSDHGLLVDGVVGDGTWAAMNGSSGGELLRSGSQGTRVRELQQKLISRGYSVGNAGADGDFGQGTYEAVVKFQRDNALLVDGIVGPATWDALNGFSNGELLRVGSKGDRVKDLQAKLISRGYDLGSAGADGDFGQSTYMAVLRFQSDNGLLVDGIVGPATWDILNGSSNDVLLKVGSKGDRVKELQQKLINRGYNLGVAGADGDFGQGTYNAVVQFQSANGLSADGVVGPLTWEMLNASPTNEFLRLGSSGESVFNLQEKLISLGYSVGSAGADGDFGQGTYNAVVKFQSDRGLSADGIVGPGTWSALNSMSNSEFLRIGSKGENVRVLQQKLINKGYSVGVAGADGDFGQGTYNAVIQFQVDNGLSADGIVGPSTWSALNGYSDWNSTVPGTSGVNKFIEVAKQELAKGFKEIQENINPYGAWYGNNGAEWCAMFVSWCANKAGIMGSLIPRYQNCALGASWYKVRGRYRTRTSGYIPKPGDIVFYTTLSGFYYHTGIVVQSSGGTISTIEGNLNDSVTTAHHSLDFIDINGYGINGGPITSIPSNQAIYRQQSDFGFANILGIEISSEGEVPIFKSPNLSITFQFSLSKIIGNPDATLEIKGGSIENVNFGNGLSEAKINFIKSQIESISSKLVQLGDSEIKMELSGISTEHFDMTLEISTEVNSNVTASQGIHIVFRKNFIDESLESALYPIQQIDIRFVVIIAIVLLIILGLWELIPVLI